ncbi:MAG: NAD(P)-binding protein [Planctomycetota bacterium]
MLPNTAVIGAGLAGLTFANRFVAHGGSVSVFDKGRGPGGRTSQRRVDVDHDGDVSLRRFHHGAQYFTASSNAFAQALEIWQERGLVAPYIGKVARIRNGEVVDAPERRRYVGTPGMNEPAKYLATNIDVRTRRKLIKLERRAGEKSDRWYLHFENGRCVGGFDLVVFTSPPVQTVELLEDHPIAAPVVEKLGEVHLRPQWAGMFAYAGEPDVPFDAAMVETHPIAGWLMATPGRRDAWTLLASHEWSEANLERDKADVANDLAAAAKDLLGLNPIYKAAHRWRYSRCDKPLGEPFVFDEAAGLAACGDWCLGDKAEHAHLSGRALADHVDGQPAL